MYTATGQLIRSFKCLSTGGVVITGEGLIQVAGSTAVQTYRRNGELMGTIGDRSVGECTKLHHVWWIIGLARHQP